MKFFEKILILCLFLQSAAFASDNFDFIQKDIIRVGISNQNFSTYKHNSAEFVSDGEMIISDLMNDKKVTAQGSANVKIELKNNELHLYVNNFPKGTFYGALVLNSKSKIGLSNLKRCGKLAYFDGAFEIKQIDENSFNIINILPMQSYLKGVVPNEMPVSFGIEALKAQAVAARNYANRAINSNANYDVCDSVQCQVYYGANSHKELASLAVDETNGIYALYENKPILTPYFSTSVGITESFENVFGQFGSKHGVKLPYLVSVYDDEDFIKLKKESDFEDFFLDNPKSYDMNSPKYRWRVVFTQEELEAVLEKTLIEQAQNVEPKFQKGQKLGKIKDIKVLKRGESGKALFVEIVTDKGKWVVKRELAIRRVFKKQARALNSANFFVEKIKCENSLDTIFDNYKKEEINFVFTGGGYGHGVGMSQYGAGAMAKEGADFYDILSHYYSGITLGTVPKTFEYNDIGLKYSTKFYYDKKFDAKMYVDNKEKLSNLHFYINDKEFDVDLGAFNSKILLFDIKKYLKKGENEIVFMSLNEKDKCKMAKFWVEVVK